MTNKKTIAACGCVPANQVLLKDPEVLESKMAPIDVNDPDLDKDEPETTSTGVLVALSLT